MAEFFKSCNYTANAYFLKKGKIKIRASYISLEIEISKERGKEGETREGGTARWELKMVWRGETKYNFFFSFF